MKENLIHARICIYNINYHVVWSVKYGRKVLPSEVEAFLKKILAETASEKGFQIHLAEGGEGDHIHCFVSAPSKLSIAYIVKMMKGFLGRKLFEFYPELRTRLFSQRKGSCLTHCVSSRGVMDVPRAIFRPGCPIIQ